MSNGMNFNINDVTQDGQYSKLNAALADSELMWIVELW